MKFHKLEKKIAKLKKATDREREIVTAKGKATPLQIHVRKNAPLVDYLADVVKDMADVEHFELKVGFDTEEKLKSAIAEGRRIFENREETPLKFPNEFMVSFSVGSIVEFMYFTIDKDGATIHEIMLVGRDVNANGLLVRVDNEGEIVTASAINKLPEEDVVNGQGKMAVDSAYLSMYLLTNGIVKPVDRSSGLKTFKRVTRNAA